MSNTAKATILGEFNTMINGKDYHAVVVTACGKVWSFTPDNGSAPTYRGTVEGDKFTFNYWDNKKGNLPLTVDLLSTEFTA